MSFEALAWAAKVRCGSPVRKGVLLALANYANDDGYCWPSQDTIASLTELSERSVRGALAELEAVGLIERTTRRRSDHSRQSDMIRLCFGASASRHEVPDSQPAGGAKTHRQEAPKPPATAAGEPPGEPLLEPGAGASARARPTFLSKSWKPNAANVAAAAAYGLNARQISRSAEKFVLYHLENGRSLKDWDSAWARWALREAERLGVSPELPLAPPGEEPPADPPSTPVFLLADSEPFREWSKTRPRGFPTRQRDGSGPRGWWFPSKWPPGHPNATEAP